MNEERGRDGVSKSVGTATKFPWTSVFSVSVGILADAGDQNQFVAIVKASRLSPLRFKECQQEINSQKWKLTESRQTALDNRILLISF